MEKEKLIYKVLAGEANGEEKAELALWIDADAKNAEAYEDIKLLYDADVDFEENPAEQNEQLADELEAMQFRISTLERRRAKWRLVKTFGSAVVISAVIFSATVFQINTSRRPPKQRALNDAVGMVLAENLVFDKTTLEDIFELLKSKYDVVVKADNTDVLTCKFTGSFSRGIPVADMLQTLGESERFEVTVKKGKTFELRGEGCHL